MNSFIINLLVAILANMSPIIRDGMIAWLKQLEVDAKKTENPWDDIFVSFLKVLLGV